MSTQSTQSIGAIAIVGGGFSGAMVAVHLLRSARYPLTVYLIEPRSTLGCGVAYSTPFDCHLMNVPAEKISAFADQPHHFLQWAEQQSSIPTVHLQSSDLNSQLLAENNCPPFVSHSFVPRTLYGQYMQAVVAETEATSSRMISKITSERARLKRIVDQVIAINPVEDRALITLQSGTVLSVDRVVLALGNAPPRHPAVADDSFYQSDRYIKSGWSSAHLHNDFHNALQNGSTHAPVVLIGSGLTAVDWAIALRQQGHQAPIHLVSRRGLLPHAHAQPHTRLNAETAMLHAIMEFNPDHGSTLQATLRHLRQGTTEAVNQGHDWRSIVDALRPHTNSIWQQLSLIEKRRFLRHLKPYWDIHRHRLAPAIAEELDKIGRSGQLQLHAGRIQAYEEDETGVDVIIRLRSSAEPISLRAGLVVNCTGSEYDYSKLTHPLIKQLLGAGLIKPDGLAIGLETKANGALISANNIPSNLLYTLGAPRRGQLWETTAIPDIREQAQQLAKTLLSSLQVHSFANSIQLAIHG